MLLLMGFWHTLTTSRYTRTLEAEVSRLRGENERLFRMLMQSHGMAIEPPKLEQAQPSLKPETQPKHSSAKVPWSVRAARIEAKVAKMNPAEVLKRLREVTP